MCEGDRFISIPPSIHAQYICPSLLVPTALLFSAHTLTAAILLPLYVQQVASVRAAASQNK